MKVIVFVISLAFISAVSSCGDGDTLERGEDRIQPKGTGSGISESGESTGAVTLPLPDQRPTTRTERQEPDREAYVPGEITVKFKDGVDLEEQHRTVSELGGTIEYTSPQSGYHKVLIPEDATVEEMVERFMEQPTVKYAEPNKIFKSQNGQ